MVFSNDGDSEYGVVSGKGNHSYLAALHTRPLAFGAVARARHDVEKYARFHLESALGGPESLS